jgi:hypothetical protein
MGLTLSEYRQGLRRWFKVGHDSPEATLNWGTLACALVHTMDKTVRGNCVSPCYQRSTMQPFIGVQLI